jgi:hypothetical protein
MSHFRVNAPNVIHEIIDGEAVLVNLETGSYYSMDRAAAVIWGYVEKGFSSDQIVEAVAAQYEGERTDIDKGTRRLLNELLDEKLIAIGDSNGANPEMPATGDAADGRARLPFDAPLLHKYTDMEDLLLLDPIHDVDESGWPNTNPNNE